jgi:hypothetical protein
MMKVFTSLIEEQDFEAFAEAHDLVLNVCESYVRRGHSERFRVWFLDLCIEGLRYDSCFATAPTINEAVARYAQLIEACRVVMPRKKGERKRKVICTPRLNFNGNIQILENMHDGMCRTVCTKKSEDDQPSPPVI